VKENDTPEPVIKTHVNTSAPEKNAPVNGHPGPDFAPREPEPEAE
jgi:hypothetical protein